METQLIEKALALTGKTMEDMNTIHYDTQICRYYFDFSIVKFGYYLLSPEFIHEYYGKYGCEMNSLSRRLLSCFLNFYPRIPEMKRTTSYFITRKDIMYRPTHHEFSILGFQYLGNQTFWLQIVEEDCMIMFRDGEYLLYGYDKSSISVFPESLDDLKTLIRILTPHD